MYIYILIILIYTLSNKLGAHVGDEASNAGSPPNSPNITGRPHPLAWRPRGPMPGFHKDHPIPTTPT